MAEELKTGDTLGDFEILEVAGAGGMGAVYKARQRALDRDVALKVIRDEIASEPEYRERFLREAKLAASVDHPNVVTLYDVGDEDGRLYLIMQWIDGSDLRQVLDGSGRLTPEQIQGKEAGSVEIVAHLANGRTRTEIANHLGIDQISISARGIQSFTVQEVGPEGNGFAIDNLGFGS